MNLYEVWSAHHVSDPSYFRTNTFQEAALKFSEGYDDRSNPRVVYVYDGAITIKVHLEPEIVAIDDGLRLIYRVGRWVRR